MRYVSFLKYILLTLFLIIISEFHQIGFKVIRKEIKALDPPLNKYISNNFSNFEYSGLIDNDVKNFIDYNGLNGASVAVINNEKLVFAKGYGFAVKEDSAYTSPGNIFRLASVSKLITAVAIMKLVEEKKLKLTDKVFGEHGFFNDPEYLQIKDPQINDITILNLLDHSGGWTQRYGDPMFMPLQISKLVGVNPPATIDTYIKFVISRNLHFMPGTAHSYSNMGYFFLGEIIKRVTHMPYEEYVRNHILFPMGIYDMQLAKNRYTDKYPNEVKYYLPGHDSLIYSYTGDSTLVSKIYGGNDIRLLGAAGGWVASAPELAKLLVSIDGFNNVKDFLSKESIDKMTGEYGHYLGWKQEYKDGWLRTGSFAGTQAVLFRENDGFQWVFLTNTSSWKGPAFSYDVIRLLKKIKRDVQKWPENDLFKINEFMASPLNIQL
jgi:CubicO group peptidase (beta-lactamase class C family)